MSSKGGYRAASFVAACMLVVWAAALQPMPAISAEIKITGATTVAFGLVMFYASLRYQLLGE